MIGPSLGRVARYATGSGSYLDIFSGLAFPGRREGGFGKNAAAVDGVYATRDGAAVAYRCYPHPEQAATAPVLLYWHGNAGTITDHDSDVELWRRLGVSLLALDFRGYAWGNGTTELSKVGEDGFDLGGANLDRVLRDCGLPTTTPAAEEKGAAPAALVVHGFSIGSVAALSFASHSAVSPHVRAVVLSGAIARFLDLPMVQTYAFLFDPLGWVAEPYRNLDIVAGLSPDAHLLVAHGDRDAIVPLAHGQRLFQAASIAAKELLVVPRAGHNDLGLARAYWEAVERTLRTALPALRVPHPVALWWKKE
jgi:uncharacterized protein